MRDRRETESDALPTVTKEMIEAVAWSASSQPGMPFGMILTDEDIKNVLSIGIANASPLQSQEPIGWWYQDSTGCIHMSLDMDLGHRHERETDHALNLMYGKSLPTQPFDTSPPPSSHLRAYPQELTDDLRDILSMMMWNTGPIAHALRDGGQDIKRKAEEEQAEVMHWLIGLALEHGSEWRAKASDRIREIRDTLAATATEASDDRPQ